jgi:hypothetical protein
MRLPAWAAERQSDADLPEGIGMSILDSILDLIITVVIGGSVAGLVVSLGKWKPKTGLLLRFKRLTMRNHYDRGGIPEHTDLPF